MASYMAAKALRRAVSSARLSSPAQAATLVQRRGLSGAADHHGPPKVACWKDPMSPSKWKEEHFVIVSLSGWCVLIFGGYKFFTGGKKEQSSNDTSSIDGLINLFEKWMEKHGKIYKSIEEKLQRFEVFKDNLKHIDERNKNVVNYWLGLNEFTDLTHDEFKKMYLRLKVDPSKSKGPVEEFTYRDFVDLPKSVD